MAISDSADPFSKVPRPALPADGARTAPDRAISDPLAILAVLHAEAEETARLANFLNRSVPAAASLTLLGAGVLVIGGGTALAGNFAWSALMLIGICAILATHIRAIRQPYMRGPLQSFGQDMTAILLYAGFAWGAGAFLALPADTGPLGAVLFSATPALMLGLLLRDRVGVLVFLVPVAALSSSAAILCAWPHGALDAGLILAALGAVAGILVFTTRTGLAAQRVLQRVTDR